MQSLDAQQGLVFLGRSTSGRPVTLENGFLKEWSFVTETSPATFHFNQVLLGVHSSNPADASFTELGVRLPGLDQWLGISGFRVELAGPGPETLIHFRKPEDCEFDLAPDLKLVFSFDCYGPTLRRPQIEASLHQEVWLLLRSSPARRFADLRRIAGRMLDLFSLLMDAPLALGAMVAQSPIGGERIAILFSPVGGGLVDTVEERLMLLRFRDVEAQLSRLISRWLESCEALQPAFDLFFSMQRRDPGYQELRFLGLVRALESLHRLRNKEQPSSQHIERIARIKASLDPKDRKWLKGRLKYSYERTLAMRMTELLQPFGDLFGEAKQRTLFVDKVINTRNYLTHYDPALRSRAVEPSKLLPYQYRLQVLFILQCLLELSFSAAEARRLIEKHDKLSQLVRFGEL